MQRQFACPPWPEKGYADWPPVEASLRNRFANRFDFLEKDLFRDAFYHTKRDKDRCGAVRRLSPVLILDKNLPFVWSTAARAGVASDADLDDIIGAAAAELTDDDVVDAILRDWHDANQPGPLKNRLRRRVMLRMIQAKARRIAKERMVPVDTFLMAEMLVWEERPEEIDQPLMKRAFDETLEASEDRVRRIVGMKRLRMKLREIRDELDALGIQLKIPSIHRLWTEFVERARKRYEELRGEN